MQHGRLALGLFLVSMVLAVPVLALAPGSAVTDLIAQLDGLLVTSAAVAMAVWVFDRLRRRRRPSRSPVPSDVVLRSRPGRLAVRTVRHGSSVRRPSGARPATRLDRDGRDVAHVSVSRQPQG